MCGPNCMRPPSRTVFGPGRPPSDIVFGPCVRPLWNRESEMAALVDALEAMVEWDEENKRNVGEGAL